MATKFLFDSFGSKDPNSTRKQHLKTVYDILQLSILQKDIPRAQKAWGILIRCPEFNASSLWKIGLGLVRNQSQESLEQLSFLRSTMLSSNDSKEEVLVEIILLLIKAEMYQEALDELELYLPSFPFQDSPVLHIYAGMLKLYIGQISMEQNNDPTYLSPFTIQEGRRHFERACELDSDNIVARGYLSWLQSKTEQSINQDDEADDVILIDTDLPIRRPRKRVK